MEGAKGVPAAQDVLTIKMQAPVKPANEVSGESPAAKVAEQQKTAKAQSAPGAKGGSSLMDLEA
jgi:hypothetical protein